MFFHLRYGNIDNCYFATTTETFRFIINGPFIMVRNICLFAKLGFHVFRNKHEKAAISAGSRVRISLRGKQ